MELSRVSSHQYLSQLIVWYIYNQTIRFTINLCCENTEAHASERTFLFGAACNTIEQLMLPQFVETTIWRTIL